MAVGMLQQIDRNLVITPDDAKLRCCKTCNSLRKFIDVGELFWPCRAEPYGAIAPALERLLLTRGFPAVFHHQ